MNKQYLANSSDRKSERGGVVAYTVISALFLFLAVGLAADLSHLYLAKTELQNTADAAALAGATALGDSKPERITLAVDRALDMTNLNKYNFNNETYNVDKANIAHRNLVEFSKNLNGTYKTESTMTATDVTEARFIKVRTPTVPINIFFSIPFLGLQRNLRAEATAGLSIPGNLNFCPAPLSVIECGPGKTCIDPKTKEELHMGGVCNEGGPLPNPDGSACDPDKQFCMNCTYTIRAAPSEGPSPGNYHALCCPGVDCGADFIRKRLAGGDKCEECPPVKPGDEVTPTTKPGETQGPIKQGINCRLDLYGGGLTPEDYPPDVNVFGNDEEEIMTYDQYGKKLPWEDPKHTPDDEPRRVLILPITAYDSWQEGRSTVTVTSLAGFFIQTRVPNGSGDIKAEYLDPRTLAAIGFDPNNVNTTNVVTWVLYK